MEVSLKSKGFQKKPFTLLERRFISMKNRKVLCFLFLLAIFALFGCTKTTEKENLNSPNVQSKSEISSLTDKEFSDLGGLNDLNNPTKESLKKLKLR